MSNNYRSNAWYLVIGFSVSCTVLVLWAIVSVAGV
ncbi:hypothetical protein Vid5_gp68 [Pantoea phage vB_PagS_Vid5]|uniref:Uncharacterized protein n=1 Tax=Pantoea phage vB_PagS_Vid5 TaxID=2099652 RepID=A0A2P1CKP8_9CAUD|nr:hypothetical protein FDJ45_gp087 [Pantoea phage vB_PagS_Vid5]AVJ51823.1 hypothetical protein Vid5_gp68 [Pantoea phage vB_PagS_Vid5]